ncbi:hypothetical protein IF655_29995 [Streptomyces sp. DSM 110735]|uniref:hypothetical protein n=1 Tax=Streptomyces sp. DSM 110735 TaxID=2775031 RepID=UPI0018F6F57E|nr:hypothetical protein [Streptomyces sp. DSM 110735]MBJ7907525.1 hypothetical protein [Streptomyces sp. DSM 110735]
MAWDEWEQLKADAAKSRSAHTRIDHVPPDGGGPVPRGDLTVHDTDLTAIGKAAHGLFEDFGHYSDHARMSSLKAAGGLTDEGFAIGSALDHVAQHWVDQVQTLLDACAHISNHLRFTKNQHAADESYIAGTLSSISELDHGFDERKGG